MTMKTNSPRAGISLIELVIACLLISSVAASVVPTVSWIMRERRAAHQRQAATEELANLMDLLTRQPWEEISPERAQQLGLAPEIQSQLPGAQLVATVDTQQEAKRIQLALAWSHDTGPPATPVKLTTWVYPASVQDASPAQEPAP